MKRFFVSVLVTISIISLISFALADYINQDPGTISKTLTSTSDYVRSITQLNINKQSTHTSWNAPFSGVSDSQRAVVRIYESGNTSPVSSTWVYTETSYITHPYKYSCQTEPLHVFFAAKVDNRDEPPITISGLFYANK